MPERPYFTRELFRFFLDLEMNNKRDWFQANRSRYEEHVKMPALQFITEFGPHLYRISHHFRADPRPVGGSLFRIHRDVRFSKDKRPYKTHCGIQFRHASGANAHTPGYYLHLEPGNCLVAVGIWHPDNPTLEKIRDAIVADPAKWQAALANRKFRARYELDGDRLKRVPRGYPADHPCADDLMWKDYFAFCGLTQKEILARDFMTRFAAICREGTPYVKFLCEAIGVEF
jgi:uncharacterized protein (TIGR02453 family)